MFRLSRWWNRVAYSVVHLGKWMVWDYTHKNGDILDCQECKYAEQILADRE